MESFSTADQIKPGDIIKCICEQGCIKPDGCQNHCKTNVCTNTPEQSWEKVLHIHRQPAVLNTWIYFSLTHDKQFGVWANTLIIKYESSST